MSGTHARAARIDMDPVVSVSFLTSSFGSQFAPPLYLNVVCFTRFMGVPSRSTVLLQPTTHCLVNITEQVIKFSLQSKCISFLLP